MKYIKKFEENGITSEKNNDVKLIITFSDYDEYTEAIKYFQLDSYFFPNDYNNENQTISFYCEDQNDADVTEKEIDKELVDNGFNNYRFESEDN